MQSSGGRADSSSKGLEPRCSYGSYVCLGRARNSLTLPLRTAGRLVEGLKCSSGGEVMDYRNLWKQETNA